MIAVELIECRHCSRPVREDSFCWCESAPLPAYNQCEYCGWWVAWNEEWSGFSTNGHQQCVEAADEEWLP